MTRKISYSDNQLLAGLVYDITADTGMLCKMYYITLTNGLGPFSPYVM